MLINTQVDKYAVVSVNANIDKLLDPNIDRRVYYVTIFVCNAGLNEAKRRSDVNNLRECIGAVDTHFLSG